MIKIYIFADSYKHFEVAIQEYIKRLGKEVEIIKLKTEKHGSPTEIIKKETAKLIEKLEKEKGYKIILSPNGKSYTTEQFFDLIEQKKQSSHSIIFAIGGANGLDYDMLTGLRDSEINLGKMTLPHSLALLVLLEQCYRLSMIKKGTSYHK